MLANAPPSTTTTCPFKFSRGNPAEACTQACIDMENYHRRAAPDDVRVRAARWQRPASDHRNASG